MSQRVVIITHSEDLNGVVPAVMAAVAARGAEALRFDTDAFPLDHQAAFSQDESGESLVLQTGAAAVQLRPGDAVWYRRARWAGKLPGSLDKQLRHGCVIESEACLRGLLAAAPCFVLDPPERVRGAAHKPMQLSLARRLGLATPRTLITNDAARAHAFVTSCANGAVAKMLAGFPVYSESGEEQVVFTTALEAHHLERLEGLRYAPMVFQERIAKQLELRVTVVGRQIFAAAVDSQATPGAEVDWRERGVALLRAWTPYTLPADVEQKLAAYMRAIDMQYSAIDLIVEPGGRHVFLEANPAGECYWLECNSPRFPFTASLADVLLDVPGARR